MGRFIIRHRFSLFVSLDIIILLYMQLYFSHQALKADGWNYLLDNGYEGYASSVRVNYDGGSPAEIQHFVEVQRRENDQLFQNGTREVQGAILDFKRPLSLAEADAFINKYGIWADSYNLTIHNPLYPNSRATLEVTLGRDGRNPQFFDNSWLDKTIATFSTNNVCTCSFVGITTMRVNLDYPHYKQLLADKDVYTVEMMAQVVKAKLENGPLLEWGLKGLYGVKLDDYNQLLHNVSYQPLYSQLERFKMVQMTEAETGNEK